MHLDAKSSPTSTEYDAARIAKIDKCVRFHVKMGHPSTEKAEKLISCTTNHGLVPGDMSRYMPVCISCWLNTFDHKRVRQVTPKIDHKWLDQFLPGECWSFDGNDMGVYSWCGHRRYALHFCDYVSTYVVVVYLSTLAAPEFCKAVEYLKNVTKLLTHGTTVKHLWSDAFKTYLSEQVTSLRLVTGVNLDVLPEYCHSFNPAENSIRLLSRRCRKNLENLVGLEVQNKTITRDSATEWWDLSYEYGRIQEMYQPNTATERRFGTGVNPTQIITGNKHELLDLERCHIFGDQGFKVIEDQERGGSSFNTSESVVYLFAAGQYNSIFNQLVKFPGSHYVVRTRTRQVLHPVAKLSFPSEKIINRRAIMSARDFTGAGLQEAVSSSSRVSSPHQTVRHPPQVLTPRALVPMEPRQRRLQLILTNRHMLVLMLATVARTRPRVEQARKNRTMALMPVSRCPYDLWLLMPRALTPMLAPLVPTLMLTQRAFTLRQRRQLPMLYSRRFSRVCHLCRF